MPSGRCPYCKRHTIFQTLSPIDNQNRPRKIGLKNGYVSLARCEHKDCQAIVYREYQPNQDEVQYDIYPPVELEADEELEGPVKRSFQSALSVFQDGHWNPACQACGRTLQDATANLRPEDMQGEEWLKKSLKQRITALAEKHIIPEPLRQWLEEARFMRVLSEHGDEYRDYWATETDAKEMLELTKWFLRYAFVLPKQLAIRKDRLAEDASKKPGA